MLICSILRAEGPKGRRSVRGNTYNFSSVEVLSGLPQAPFFRAKGPEGRRSIRATISKIFFDFRQFLYTNPCTTLKDSCVPEMQHGILAKVPNAFTSQVLVKINEFDHDFGNGS